MIFTRFLVFVFSILLWLGVWAAFKFLYPIIYAKMRPHANIYKLERGSVIGAYILKFGWIAVLPITILGLSIFPKVTVVAEKYGELSFEQYYAPFFCDGQFCSRKTLNIYNNTESAIVLYSNRAQNIYRTDIAIIDEGSLLMCDSKLAERYKDVFDRKNLGDEWKLRTRTHAAESMAWLDATEITGEWYDSEAKSHICDSLTTIYLNHIDKLTKVQNR